jgi:transposase-like protein
MGATMRASTELDQIRSVLAELGHRGRGRRYPAALKAAVVAYAERQRAEGASVSKIARDLGLDAWTLTTWRRAAPVPPQRPSTFVPVRVVPTSPPPKRLRIRTRAGLRIDGLDIDTLVELVRRLG